MANSNALLVDPRRIRSYRDHWAHTNGIKLRLRVNDSGVSTHPEYGDREESRHNGLALVDVPLRISDVEQVVLIAEVWGGHPLTTRKRFAINGRRTYDLPDDGVAAGHCAYTFPSVLLDRSDIVRGTNAVQFGCDRGDGFWGHFIVDNAAIRTRYAVAADTACKHRAALANARVHVDHVVRDGMDTWEFSLELPPVYVEQISSVEYSVRRLAYPWAGALEPVSYGLHSFTRNRARQGHVGTGFGPEFRCTWCPSDLLGQSCRMHLQVRVAFVDGSFAALPPVPMSHPELSRIYSLYTPAELPIPFWSRDSLCVDTVIPLRIPKGVLVREARLCIRLWDGADDPGGAGVRLNGIRLTVLDGTADHDVVLVDLPLDPGILTERNVLSIQSNTIHHGLEVLLPGPAIGIMTDHRR